MGPLASSIQCWGTGSSPASTSSTRIRDSGSDSATGSASSTARRAPAMPLSSRSATIAVTASSVTSPPRTTASRSATASGSGRPSSRSSVSRSGPARRPPIHGSQSAGSMSVRRTDSPRRCPSRISSGASTCTGSSGQAIRTPRTVAADRPVITTPAGIASASARQRRSCVTVADAGA
ncbi:hypothetical protein BJF78_11105 [Pseudonocardia sp. CNS-139]|nr:hypothetical protein BJF78_11105 [Pseudonocardia sp. CNS-139]